MRIELNSSSSSSGPRAARAPRARPEQSVAQVGTINGAGSTLAAPIYQQWGSTLKGQGLTVNYNPVGSGAGIAQICRPRPSTSPAAIPRSSPSDESRREGPASSSSRSRFGAITVSYNLSGVKSGIKLDGPTIANIFLGKIKTWNDPAIKALNPGIEPAQHRDHGRSPLRLLGHDERVHHVPCRPTAPTWTSTVGSRQGRQVADRHRRGQGNSGVAAAVKQTDGAVGYVEQAYALENGFTYASVKNSSGQLRAADDRRTPRPRPNGIKVPADLGISTINSPEPGGLPDRVADVPDRLQGPVQGGRTPVGRGQRA